MIEIRYNNSWGTIVPFDDLPDWAKEYLAEARTKYKDDPRKFMELFNAFHNGMVALHSMTWAFNLSGKRIRQASKKGGEARKETADIAARNPLLAREWEKRFKELGKKGKAYEAVQNWWKGKSGELISRKLIYRAIKKVSDKA
ncbi:MAG: hypothetical protein HY717_15075 [Planctomycetes bacterium]|nr:hypothetical protein [Planctomycetota bacterium]